MTKDELIAKLKDCELYMDTELGHVEADAALLAYINDPEITTAFNAVSKWYA